MITEPKIEDRIEQPYIAIRTQVTMQELGSVIPQRLGDVLVWLEHQGNWALLKWGAEKGLVWDAWKTDQGDAFSARIESFLTNPDEEPDQAQWEIDPGPRYANFRT